MGKMGPSEKKSYILCIYQRHKFHSMCNKWVFGLVRIVRPTYNIDLCRSAKIHFQKKPNFGISKMKVQSHTFLKGPKNC